MSLLHVMGTMGCFLAPLEFVMIHDPSAVISPNFIGTSPACEGLLRDGSYTFLKRCDT